MATAISRIYWREPKVGAVYRAHRRTSVLPIRSAFLAFRQLHGSRPPLKAATSTVRQSSQNHSSWLSSSRAFSSALSSSAQESLSRKGKTIVLCLDGTGDEYDNDETNVVRLFGCLEKNKPDEQIVYYRTGVGTTVTPSLLTPITRWLAKMSDQAVAWYLDSHIIGAYTFIQENWVEGDKICIFGFSRGAYSARALAGMLHSIGLLPKGMHDQAEFGYTIWKRGEAEECARYKRLMSRDVDVEFIGVWDTVSSVGALFPRVLPFSLHNKTRVFRHALALDEHRARFRANTYHYTNPSEGVFTLMGLGVKTMTEIKRWILSQFQQRRRQDEAESDGVEEVPSKATKAKYVETTQDVDAKEVWFVGDHCDVGGGNTPNGRPHALSYIPLRWMIKEVLKTNVPILFKPSELAVYGLTLPPVDPITREIQGHPDARYYIGTEGRVENVWATRVGDVGAVRHDNLRRARGIFWWFLEILPVVEYRQKPALRNPELLLKELDNTSEMHLRLNLFRPRDIPVTEPPSSGKDREVWINDRKLGIPPPGPFFHESVRERMNLESERRAASGLFRRGNTSHYKPLAWPKDVDPIFTE